MKWGREGEEKRFKLSRVWLNTSRVWGIVTGNQEWPCEARDLRATESVTETMSQDRTQDYELNLNTSEECYENGQVQFMERGLPLIQANRQRSLIKLRALEPDGRTSGQVSEGKAHEPRQPACLVPVAPFSSRARLWCFAASSRPVPRWQWLEARACLCCVFHGIGQRIMPACLATAGLVVVAVVVSPTVLD